MQAEAALERKRHNVLVLVLAGIMAIGPFATDMYLPGFLAIARGLKTDIARVGLSLTSFFIGVCIGQIIYGPLLDRYGRKKPLMLGLLVYTIGSISGAHVNPAITLGLYVLNKIDATRATRYIIAQLCGGVLQNTRL